MKSVSHSNHLYPMSDRCVSSSDGAEGQVISIHSELKVEIYLSHKILFSIMSLNVF
jgi:hypothetical protein